MKILKKITNGVLLIVIGIMHTQFALSADVFGKQFQQFSQACFFKVHPGMEDIPFVAGHTNLEAFSAFWFFYFGIFIIPLGLLVHSIERNGKTLPHYFTVAYLLVVAMGSYMLPSSGITYIMLPHAVYMLVINCWKAKKLRVVNS